MTVTTLFNMSSMNTSTIVTIAVGTIVTGALGTLWIAIPRQCRLD